MLTAVRTLPALRPAVLPPIPLDALRTLRRVKASAEPLFFFARHAQADLERLRADRPIPFTLVAARRALAAFRAEAEPILLASAERRAQLRLEAGDAFNLPEPDAEAIAALLAVGDAMPVWLFDPVEGRSFHVRASGIENVEQLHVMLADLLTGNERHGWLPGARPDARLAAYARGIGPAVEVTTGPSFGLYLPGALTAEGTLREGFAAADAWLPPTAGPERVPMSHGEHVLLLGRPAYPRSWALNRRFPTLTADVKLVAMERL